MASAEDEDVPQLSAGALDALKQFYGEKDQRQKQFEDLKAQAEQDFDAGQLSMESFTEDWNTSQFWYTDETAAALAKALLDGATDASAIAVVSAPSVFIQLKNILASDKAAGKVDIVLLEFDQRFSVFKEFVPYDLNEPSRLPDGLKGRFDRIICDPPFLSEDCQTKAALTVRWLAKSWTASTRVLVCTGERMEPLIHKLYGKVGVKTTTFEPQHAKGLSNEFRCYSNISSDKWKLKDVNS